MEIQLCAPVVEDVLCCVRCPMYVVRLGDEGVVGDF